MIQSTFKTTLLAAALSTLAGCGINTGEIIDFDNPFCQDIDLTFTKDDSLAYWTQEVDVNNVIRDEYDLETITIEASEAVEIAYITMVAPDGTRFVYPGTGSTRRTFEESIGSSTATYTVSNVESESSIGGVGGSGATTREYYCEEHMGIWELKISYLPREVPDDVGTDDALHVTYTICFEYDL